ncbi:GH-E family nuclease [Flavivirga aquimarina]|uniref:GH-E family nuclease n=1 Tax=Flavivirga aquimarina TaxID=2027862 RepID=A0ABT8WFR6_9FLAO|nr:GH-E family nuclease [Flavivirga aquimarina]MDO5971995.1 GH-E family nuclease [Flavivirga aquimarina]
MKDMFTKVKTSLSIKVAVFLFFGFYFAQAQDFKDTFTGAEITGALTTNSSSALAESTDVNPYTYLSLSIKEDTAPFTAYKFSITLEVTPILSDGTPDTSSQEITLEVENNLAAGIGNVVDFTQYIINDRYGVNVLVLSNTFEDIETDTVTNDAPVPDNIVLEVGFNTKRYFELPEAAPAIQAHTVNSDNELEINWTVVTGARFYDVEWTWIDNYNEDITTPLGSTEISLSVKDFERNNTRIQTNQTTFTIPLVYSRGFIIYRVRAVGNFSAAIDPSLSKNKYSEWSITPTKPVGADDSWKAKISDWADADKNVLEIDGLKEHAANKNWQFQASYAEEGKKKEVVSYFDGSLRNRQTVTTINTDENAIVGEVIYDAQGRPAVEVLPVPTNENKLQYYDNFNRSTDPARTSQSYSYLDFDEDTQNIIDTESDDKKMNVSSGASSYYSDDSSNTLVSDYKNRIPNALEYPFSQIEYTPDNTGRIRRKSGVGKTHQLGSGHDMEYYYGFPEQIELNRLFGYSVGNASHYKKNMVLDPNRQLSISYIDPQGRTIATALTGASAFNLEGLDNEDGNAEDIFGNKLHDRLTADLLNKIISDATDTPEDNNQIGTSGNFGALQDQLSFNASKMVVFNDSRIFNYSINVPTFSYGCPDPNNTSGFTKNYPLTYNLNIDVLDGDGKSLFPEDSGTGAPKPYQGTISLDGTNTITLTSEELPPIPVERGSYTIIKNLEVDKIAVETHADDYIRRLQDPSDACYVAIEDITPALDPIILEGCEFTCEACESALIGTYSTTEEARQAYVNEQISNNQAQYDLLSEDEKNEFVLSIEAQWNEALDTCRATCADVANPTVSTPNIISCQTALDQLLQDMSPLGQYGNGSEGAETILNIFDENNKLISTRINPNADEPLYYSWKNPWHADYDASVSKTEGHYYNENGTISYIKVKEIVTIEGEGEEAVEIITYEPTINEGTPLTAVDSSSDEYWVEPQYLTNSSDFTDDDIWQDSWSYSLLSYHPEYDYLLYSNAVCELQKNDFSSDGFDAYLQSLNTYDKAINGGVTGTGFLNTVLDLYNADPYFSSALPAPFDPTSHNLLNVRKDIMEEALQTNFDGSGKSLIASTYARYICTSITECVVPNNSAILSEINSLSDLTTQQKDEFWNAYKANYLSLKQRMQSVFMNAYAQKNGIYNGCIGLSEAPVDLIANISTYNHSVAVTFEGYMAGVDPADGICSDAFADNYITKQKRFLPSDMYFNAGADPEDVLADVAEQVNYQYYVDTGICPLSRDLVLYLDGYFRDSNVSGNTATDSNREYNALYLSSTLFEEFGGAFPAPASSVSTTGTIGATNEELVLSINSGGNLENSDITINLPGYNWTNYGTGFTIISVSTNVITSSYDDTTKLFSYKALAKLDINGDNKEVVITGTTKARITCSTTNPLSEGQYLGDGNTYDETGACNKESYFSKAMLALMKRLLATNEINDSSVDISNLEAYTNSYLPEYFEGGTTITWNYSGANTYVLNIDGIDRFSMSLDTPLPNNSFGLKITNIHFDYVYSTNQSNVIAQNVKVNWLASYNQRQSAIGTVQATEETLLNFLCCDDVNNYKEFSDSYTYVYNGKKFSTSNQAVGHTWSADGNILYISFHNSTGRQYLCSTPYDVSTANLNGSSSIFGQGEGIHITSSGNFMIHKFHDIQGEIILYEFSVPHDISTMTEVSRVNLPGIVHDVDVFMTDNGLNMYLFKTEGLTRYSLSAPFDLSNPTQEETLTTGAGRSFTFSKDLKKLLILYGSGNPILKTYLLTTPGDLSTAYLDNEQPFDALIEGSTYNFPRIRISPDNNYLTVSTYGGAYPIYTFEKSNINQYQSEELINKFKPAFILRKMVTDTSGAHKFYYKNIEFIPKGFKATIDELIDLEIDINFSNYSENPEDYNSAEIILNGKSYKLSTNDIIFNPYEGEQVGYRRPPTNRFSWDYTSANDWGATFDIFNFAYNINGVQRTYNFNEGSGTAQSTDGIGVITLDNNSWITDPSLGSGLRFNTSLEAAWNDFIPFIHEQGVNLNFKASLKIQDVLPVSTGNGYGFISQIDYEDPLNPENLYQLEIYVTTGDDVIPDHILNCSDSNKECIAQPVTPVSCSDKYLTYISILNNLGIDTVTEGEGRSPQYYTEEEFCDKQLAYITDDYEHYINTLVLSETDPEVVTEPTLSIHYITIANFGATEFGYGYDEDPNDNVIGMQGIVDLYATDVANASNTDAIKSWVKFTSDHLYALTTEGTICISLPGPLPITTEDYTIDLPEDSPCEQLTKAIHSSYSNDAYANFLKREREAFINEYLKHAIGEVDEDFTMDYFDKEYQYTLYYYDQSGNLIQTVPPEGVNRFSKQQLEAVVDGSTLHERINQYRKDNPEEENSELLPPHDYKTQYAYNSLNQLVWQFTPDGGETRFAYDALGRIVASQNKKQLDNNTFSYTVYDKLGRITEAGELEPKEVIAINQTEGKLEDNLGNLVFTDGFSDDPDKILFPKNISDKQNEVTRTKYSKYLSNPNTVFKTLDAHNIFANSRNRVTEIYYFDDVTTQTADIDFNNAIYYNYDIHGNVKELVHHNRLLAKSSMYYSGLKRVEYEYDLISGNVNKVYYQKDAPDQFIHQYTYDADNRITNVQTSSDGIIWETDASYNYYKHGPLARTELGDKKVQGQDYAYAIQGWLKGVNSDELDPANDLGGDGDTGSNIAKDAYGFALTYNDEDYQSIGTINAFINSSASGPNNTSDLYNGNIRLMSTGVMNTEEVSLGSQINHYTYDQLNRIKSMRGFNTSNNPNYSSDYSYDRNGNLNSLKRSTINDANQVVQMDELSYKYNNTKENPLTGETSKNNQLNYVTDAVGDAGFNDLDTQPVNNYEYDEIGQLVSDNSENITNIDWRVDGKVASITKTGGIEIHFEYDGLGNRIAKTVLPENKTTIYTRDAQGNVLAVYETNETDVTNISENKEVTLKEHHIYGSSRLGIEQKSIPIPEDGETIIVQDNIVLTTGNIITTESLLAENNIDVAGNANVYTVANTGDLTLKAGERIILKHGFSTNLGAKFKAKIEDVSATLPAGVFARTVGDKCYELSNHLGNVLSVVSDRKLVADPLNFTNFTADVLTYNDYYPFGQLLPNRHGSSDSYRYGFNGKEKDDEVKGEGAQYDYGFRIYDPRLGKFLSTDPLFKGYPHYTPYQFAGNTPIQAMDLDGLEEYYYWNELKKETSKIQLELVPIPYNPPDVSAFGFYQSREDAEKWGRLPYLKKEREQQIEQHNRAVEAYNNYVRNSNPVWWLATQANPLAGTYYAIKDYSEGEYFWGTVEGIFVALEVAPFLRGTKAFKNLNFSKSINRLPLEDFAEHAVREFGNVVERIYKSRNRPSFRKGKKGEMGVVEQVWENAPRDANGNVIDINTGEILTWDKSKSRFGQWDMGHKPGKEWHKLRQDYIDGKVTWQEVLDEYNNPRNYVPENPSSNRSGAHEGSPRPERE